MRHDSADKPASSDARVTAAHGRHFRILLADGTQAAARSARRELRPVCGDTVRCRFDNAHAEYHIEAIVPRRTQLARTDSRGVAELLAANVSLMVCVVAPQPAADFFIVDRYLAAAACAGMHGAVAFNKTDLDAGDAARAELADYRRIGYPVLRLCSRDGTGLDALRTLLRAETAILVGQSGVGKSSLLRALAPDCEAGIGALDRADEGRHTTTVARLYQLPDGGELIDSPGVRDFAPALAALEPTTLGFIDIAQLAPGCRFPDCAHLAEPDCAVRAATTTGGLSARRYESYRRLRRLHQRLLPGPGGRRMDH